MTCNSRQIKAIPTTYNGRKYRSRLESRWAKVFDELEIAFVYEGVGVEINGLRYLPDWDFPDWGIYGECKGGSFDDKSDLEFRKCGELSLATKRSVVLLTRQPDPENPIYEILRYDEGARDSFLETWSFPVPESDYKRAALAALNTKFGRF